MSAGSAAPTEYFYHSSRPTGAFLAQFLLVRCTAGRNTHKRDRFYGPYYL